MLYAGKRNLHLNWNKSSISNVFCVLIFELIFQKRNVLKIHKKQVLRTYLFSRRKWYLGTWSSPATPSHRGVNCCSCSSNILLKQSIGALVSAMDKNRLRIILWAYFVMFISSGKTNHIYLFQNNPDSDQQQLWNIKGSLPVIKSAKICLCIGCTEVVKITKYFKGYIWKCACLLVSSLQVPDGLKVSENKTTMFLIAEKETNCLLTRF